MVQQVDVHSRGLPLRALVPEAGAATNVRLVKPPHGPATSRHELTAARHRNRPLMPTWRSTRVSTGNPFGTHAGWYVNPAVWDKQNEAVKQGYLDGKTTEASVIEEMMEAPTAFWVDSKAKVTASTGGGTYDSVPDILADAAAKERPSLVTLILYSA